MDTASTDVVIKGPDDVKEIFAHMSRALDGLGAEISRELNDLKNRGTLPQSTCLSLETEVGGFRYFLTMLPVGGETNLTKREREIAGLVARGLENRAIAEELHIACPTVAVHLRSIFKKWRVNSRTQLARQIIVGGLTHN